ncbi:hypothetical protein [Nostoc sp. CCY 9925]|uniref:hypothetical protein n=1 Tax=Nostoc sp. CCY 9925 TaxID=3103865 RepID=UPI0039C66DE6
MSRKPLLGKALHLFSEIQNHLHNGTIYHELSQISRHTRDKEILDICQRAADCLEIEIDSSFKENNVDQHFHSLKTLVKHLQKANQIFNSILEIISECNPKWTEALFKATESQIVSLSNYYALLDKIPDVTDINGEPVKPGDLVYVECQDEEGKNYQHYGIVTPSQKGFRVAHFFTGATVKAQNSLVEKGFGYVHEVYYSPEWIVKEHLPDSIPFSQVEGRIKESRKEERRLWNKLRYNCEHWARQMFSGEARCTQLEERRNKKEATLNC